MEPCLKKKFLSCYSSWRLSKKLVRLTILVALLYADFRLVFNQKDKQSNYACFTARLSCYCPTQLNWRGLCHALQIVQNTCTINSRVNKENVRHSYLENKIKSSPYFFLPSTFSFVAVYILCLYLFVCTWYVQCTLSVRLAQLLTEQLEGSVRKRTSVRRQSMARSNKTHFQIRILQSELDIKGLHP